MKSKSKLLLLGLISGAFLSSCSAMDIFGKSEDPPLPGERVSVLELQRDLEPEDKALNEQGFMAPKAWQNEFWPQRGGYPNHAMQNLAFTEGAFKEAWSVSIGGGASRTHPLSAQPIIVGNRVFTLDTKLEVRSFSIKDGRQIWATSVKPPKEKEAAIGGGLAFGENMLYATNGFAEIAALDPNSGKLIWRKTLPATARNAPTILNKALYIQLSNSELMALDAASGDEIWRYSGFQAESGLLGASSPAASQNQIVTALPSGELTAINPENGAVLWSDSLAPRHRTGGIASVSDVTGLPVIDNDIVIAAGFGKKMLAIDAQSGRRVWQREIGSLETPWVCGNFVFILTTEKKLVALGRDTGSVAWVADLSAFNKEKNEYWTGPVFAGGRLIIASSEGQIAEIDAQNGKIIRTSRTAGSVSIAPAVAGGTLYILSDNGKLTAYR